VRWRDLGAAPNLLSLLRLALVPVAILLRVAGRRPACAVVLGAMVLTDGLDGLIARRTGRITALGRILDPVADKVAIDSLLVTLALRGEFPAWALAVVLGRDVAILAGAALIATRTTRVPAAVSVGKVALVLLGAMTFVFVLDLEPVEPAVHVAGVAGVVASGIAYAAVARSALRADRARA
jgi:phosphatidylglycerophosphate synthase